MSQNLAIVPQPVGASGFVELSRTQKGKLFEKHILTIGKLHYGGSVIDVDDDMVDTMVKNFTNGVCDIVQIPKAGPKNEHSEDPDRNIGQVIGLSKRDGKLYATLDVRKDADDVGKTLLGASAMFHMNYPDTRTGLPAGPTLLHVAVTNRPHVVDLEDYSEVIAASADGSDRDAVILTAVEPPREEKHMPTKDEHIAALRDEHGIDVVQLTNDLESKGKALDEVQNKLAASGVIKLSNGENFSADEIVGAVADLASGSAAQRQEIVTLSARVEEVEKASERQAAEARVDSLVTDGFIAPAERDSRLKLLLTNSELFDEMLPEKPIIKLSNRDNDEIVELSAEQASKDELDRLSAIGA